MGSAITSFKELVDASDKELFKELKDRTINIRINDDSDSNSKHELFELSRIRFTDCDISVKYAVFKNCEFEGCTMRMITDCDICGAMFDSCIFFGSVISLCTIREAVFNHCRFERTNRFDACDLSESKFNFCSGGNMNFVGCDLRNTFFEKTDLAGSWFSDCDMEYVNLRGADLYNADLSGNKNTDKIYADTDTKFFRQQCPETGSFVAWKKVRDYYSKQPYLVKLLIPEDAKRSSATSYKCRAEFAEVLGIYKESGAESAQFAVLNRHIGRMDTDYVVGKMVYPDSFDENRWKECSHGIHFFMNFECAKQYNV